jgi:hypothetical protein
MMEQPAKRRNKNRGYQKLRVWQDATELYRLTSLAVQDWPFERKRVAAQAIASADSVHRNIAEGYCRRTIREYLQFLNIPLDRSERAYPDTQLTIPPDIFRSRISSPWMLSRFDLRTAC